MERWRVEEGGGRGRRDGRRGRECGYAVCVCTCVYSLYMLCVLTWLTSWLHSLQWGLLHSLSEERI